MGKSDEKTLVKKPDIIMEQLEDRMVFAADVANAAPVAAVTAGQAQAHSDPGAGVADGGGTHAPDAPHHDATAASRPWPFLSHGPCRHFQRSHEGRFIPPRSR